MRIFPTPASRKSGSRAFAPPADIQKLDSCIHVAKLQAIGRAAARKVDERHFAGFAP